MPRNESRDPAYLWDRLDTARAISAFVAELIPLLKPLLPEATTDDKP